MYYLMVVGNYEVSILKDKSVIPGVCKFVIVSVRIYTLIKMYLLTYFVSSLPDLNFLNKLVAC